MPPLPLPRRTGAIEDLLGGRLAGRQAKAAGGRDRAERRRQRFPHEDHHGAACRVPPPVAHRERASHRERRRRLARRRASGSARAGEHGIEGERADPARRRAARSAASASGHTSPSSATSDEGRRDREPAAGRQRDHFGASTCSRIARSAASAVTPSSSSSGATTTRWRSPASAVPFTSSGTT